MEALLSKFASFSAESRVDSFSLLHRPRRNRKSSAVRALVRENHLLASDLVAPLFLIEGSHREEEIPSFFGVKRKTVDLALRELEQLQKKGVESAILFPHIPKSRKDPLGSEALNPHGLIPEAAQIIKSEFPELCLFADIALDPFTSHGHDGVVDQRGRVLNDETVAILVEMALLYAKAGVDFVAPSDMMDGRVGAIRRHLDAHDLSSVGILSYTAKYASSLYTPFRHMLESGVAFGDKKSYQMDPANLREAMRQAALDEAQGADMLMVKPALYYLDVLAKMRASTELPLCAYHVSGEYAMVMAGHQLGALDAPSVFAEALLSIKRAGADFIISYAIPQILHRI